VNFSSSSTIIIIIVYNGHRLGSVTSDASHRLETLDKQFSSSQNNNRSFNNCNGICAVVGIVIVIIIGVIAKKARR